MSDERRRFGLASLLVTFYVVAVVVIVAVDRMTHGLFLLQTERGGSLSLSYRPLALVANVYLRAREHTAFWLQALAFGPVLLVWAVKSWLVTTYRWGAEIAGFAFKKAKYTLPVRSFSLRDAIDHNPRPETQVAIGAEPARRGRSIRAFCGCSRSSSGILAALASYSSAATARPRLAIASALITRSVARLISG